MLRLVQALQARMRLIRVALASEGVDSRRRNEWSARYQSIGFRIRASSFSTAGQVLLEWDKDGGDLLLQEESRLVSKALAQEEEEDEQVVKGRSRSTLPKCAAAFDRKACPLALIRKPPTLQLFHGSPTWAILQQFVVDVKPKVQRFFSIAYQTKQPPNHDLTWVSRHTVTLAMNLFEWSQRLYRGNPVVDKPRMHLNIVLLQCIAEFVKRGYNGDLLEGVRALVKQTAFPGGAHPLLAVAQEFARIGSWEKLEALGKFNVCKLALETQQVLFCGAQDTALTYANQETSFLYTYTLHPDQRAASWFVRLNDPKTLWGMLEDDMPFGVHAEEEEEEGVKDANIRYKYSPANLVYRLVSAAGKRVTELRDKYQPLGAIKATPEDEVGYVLMPILLRLHQLFRFKEPRALAALARVTQDGLGAHEIERNAFLEDVVGLMEEHRSTSILELMADRDEGIASSMVYNWDKLFEVPLSSRRVVWVGMYPDFFGGSGRHILRDSYYEEDAMLVSMFVRSKWYQANKACVIGWFGNSQHEWVVADPQVRGVLAKFVPGINVAGPIDNIFRKFEDYEMYQ